MIDNSLWHSYTNLMIKWRPDAAMPPRWAQIAPFWAWGMSGGLDFGEATEVSSITVDYFSCDFLADETLVQMSHDGVTWTDVGILPTQDPAFMTVDLMHRYVRLSMSGYHPTLGNTPAIREIDFDLAAPAAPEDCFTEAPTEVTGGPSLSSSSLPPKAFDGSISTFWQGSYDVTTWELIFDFTVASPVDSVTVDYYSCSFLADATLVQVSDDGTTWTDVGTLPKQDSAYLAVNQSHRYLRLAMSGLNLVTGYTPAIREVDFNLAAPAAPVSCPN